MDFTFLVDFHKVNIIQFDKTLGQNNDIKFSKTGDISSTVYLGKIQILVYEFFLLINYNDLHSHNYHISHFSVGFIGVLGAQLKSFANSFKLLNTPMMR